MIPTDLDLVTRQQWGAKPFPFVHWRTTHTHVEMHHDVYRRALGFTGIQHCKAIEGLHLGRGWNGPFYNFGMDARGVLYELRGLGNGSVASSPGALTVVLFGDYHNHDRVTTEQIHTIGRLLSVWRRPIDWHAKRAAGTPNASSCPGRHAIPVIRNIKPIKEEEVALSQADVERIADAVVRKVMGYQSQPDRRTVEFYIRNTNERTERIEGQVGKS